MLIFKNQNLPLRLLLTSGCIVFVVDSKINTS